MPETDPGLCPTENALTEFVAGALGSVAMAEVERHLGRCALCRAVVDEIAMATGAEPATPMPDRDGAREGSIEDDAAAVPLEERGLRLQPGTIVGRYVIHELLGAGAMGAVYAARDPVLDRRIAVKVVRPDVIQGSDNRQATEQRLLREAQAMARLSSPNVIQVFDVGSIGSQLFIAMEFIDGGTLRDWLSRAPRSWREVLEVFHNIGRGLAAAHSAGLVHRDFKPDNVLVGNDGRVCIADFGLVRGSNARIENQPSARDAGALPPTMTRTGSIIGTPAYMAPEQLRGDLADARSDIFSFSVTLYEALYGERPFRGDTAEELVHAALSSGERPPTPGSTVPEWLRSAVLRGLRATPEERPASIDAFLGSLEEPKQRARRRWIVAALVTVAAAGAALGYLGSGGIEREARGPKSRSSAAEGEGGSRPMLGSEDTAQRPKEQTSGATAAVAQGDEISRGAGDAQRDEISRAPADARSIATPKRAASESQRPPTPPGHAEQPKQKGPRRLTKTEDAAMSSRPHSSEQASRVDAVDQPKPSAEVRTKRVLRADIHAQLRELERAHDDLALTGRIADEIAHEAEKLPPRERRGILIACRRAKLGGGIAALSAALRALDVATSTRSADSR